MEKKKYSIIFVVDCKWNGHIPTYHLYICKALLELGYTVHSVSPNPGYVEQWLAARAPHNIHNGFFHVWDKNEPIPHQLNEGATVQVNTNPAPLKLSLRQYVIKTILNLPILKKRFKVHELWKAIQMRIEQILPDCNTRKDVFVLVPYLDAKLLAPYYSPMLFKNAFKLPWAGIYFHPSFFRTGKGRASTMLNFFKSPTCHSIALLDEGMIKKFAETVKKPAIQFPDITNDELDKANLAPIAIEIKRMAAGRKIISLLGVINNKKNVLTLLQVIKLCNEQNLPFLFLIAGENNKYYWSSEEDYKQVCHAIETYPDNTYWHLQSLKDGHEYNSLVEISDVIMASYKSFYHSSNTLTKAALFKKPLIVSKGYLMDERVTKYNMGIAINENDPEMFLNAIKHLSNNTDLNGRPLTPNYDAYYKQHTYNRLKQAITEMIV